MYKLLSRCLIFFAFSLYIIFGPLLTQVLGIKSIYLPRWIIFTGAGREIFDISFNQIIDGNEFELDYLSILGFKNKYSSPKRYRQITSEETIKEIGKHLCKSLGINADIHVRGRRGTRTLWAEYSSRNKNICDENS